MGENPFLEKEEKEDNEDREYYKAHKPYQKEKLTESQSKRNLKGIKMVRENLKKIIPFRY